MAFRLLTERCQDQADREHATRKREPVSGDMRKNRNLKRKERI